MIRPELEDVAEVEGRLLEMPVRFQDFTKLKRDSSLECNRDKAI